ncbi:MULTISPECIES: hypothetical protein [unclassified Frankia]|uniref:hypothetical protein n=1 Tax=unclassified Frankia TaxID=2632575 RepID=UPI002AD527CF|nr:MULTISPECIES: hypothetical protein [unclassified Frankia]
MIGSRPAYPNAEPEFGYHGRTDEPADPGGGRQGRPHGSFRAPGNPKHAAAGPAGAREWATAEPESSLDPRAGHLPDMGSQAPGGISGQVHARERGVTQRPVAPQSAPQSVAQDAPLEGAVAEHVPDLERGGAGAGRSAQPQPAGAGRLAGLVVCAAGVAAGAGAVLPWSILSSGAETRTFSGLTVGDGRVTMVAGALLVVIGFARVLGRPTGAADGLVVRVLAAGVTVLSTMDIVAGPPSLSSFRGLSADQISVVPESGLVLTLVAGLVALAGSVRLRRGHPAP